MGILVEFPIMFISGIFVLLSQLPAVAKDLSLTSPLADFTGLARYAMGGTNYYPALGYLLAILYFTVVFWAATASLHKRTLPKRV